MKTLHANSTFATSFWGLLILIMLAGLEVSYSWPRQGVLQRKFVGSLTMEGMLSSFEDVLTLRVVDKLPMGIITDLRNAELDMNHYDMAKFKVFYNHYQQQYDKLVIAIVVNSPQATALAQIAQRKVGSLNNEIFYTQNAALKWVVNRLEIRRMA